MIRTLTESPRTWGCGLCLLACFVLLAGLTPPSARAGELSIDKKFAQIAPEYPMRWWPVQKEPSKIVRTHYRLFEHYPPPKGYGQDGGFTPDHMLAQSLSGLAARAVNEGRHDELVWIGLPNRPYNVWFEMNLDVMDLEPGPEMTPWAILERYIDAGIVKGYILYRYDSSEGEVPAMRPGLDESCNVATSLASVFEAVIIAEHQEERAKALGLECLFDARGKDDTWQLEHFADKLSDSMIVFQDPRVSNLRALAIAQGMMVAFGDDEVTDRILANMRPLSGAYGWNAGDEGEMIAQIADWGHVLYPCNWSMNMPLMMAGAEKRETARFRTFDPEAYEVDPAKPATAFVISDGDNIQWAMGDLPLSDVYWNSPDNGDFPIGWGLPVADLAQASPVTLTYLADTQPPDASILLICGGYFYPDLFAEKLDRETRLALLDIHARRIGHAMEATGTRIWSFIAMDLWSEDTREALEIMASHIPNLTGFMGIQYAPYEAGDGKVIWITPRDGGDPVPLTTAKFGLWANNGNPTAGEPDEVAEMINESAKKPGIENQLQWTIVHAWSSFYKRDDGTIESARGYKPQGSATGVTPTGWVVEQLDPDIQVVPPELLLHLIRQRGAEGP